ncbi:MAG: YbaK/EbsC family protein [Candidatus Kerfeldbacteria bacterium]|nr:YbaK/EbsC family protein [Candidatus Kerfeldbacteria bacterium]
MKIPTKVAAYLKKAKVAHDVVPHKTVFTAYDLGQTLKTKLENIAKTLLVRVDTTYHLVVLRAADRLDLKKLKAVLGAKQVNIAREQDMAREMKVKPGALTPFGGLHKLGLVVDRNLTKAKTALFGSGSFEHSIRMKVADWLKLERPKTGSFSTSADLKLQVKPTRPPRKR